MVVSAVDLTTEAPELVSQSDRRDLEPTPPATDPPRSEVAPLASIDIFAKFGRAVAEFDKEADKSSSHFSEQAWQPPQGAAEDRGASAQLFDHYWRQGSIREASDVLIETASGSMHEPWWQARQALLQQSPLSTGVDAPRQAHQALLQQSPLSAGIDTPRQAHQALLQQSPLSAGVDTPRQAHQALLKQSPLSAGIDTPRQAHQALLQQSPLPAGVDTPRQAHQALLKQSLASAADDTPRQASDSQLGNNIEDVAAPAAEEHSPVRLSRAGFLPEIQESPVQLGMRDADWRPLYAELQRIIARRRLPPASPARYEAYSRCLAGKALSEGFIKALAAVGGEHLTQQARDQLWTLQGVWWHGEHHEASYELLKYLHLQYSEPRWLGLYLDALVATGRASQVVHALRLVLQRPELNPKLEWAKEGMLRVRAASERLGIVILPWSEDEGIESLLKKLTLRPRPLLRSLVPADSTETTSTGHKHQGNKHNQHCQ